MAERLPGRLFRSQESAETVLARNLLAARTAAGWTQDALSAASGISRATIAQLETGVSDPRMSTLAALATALRLPLALLVIGGPEMRAMAGLLARQAAVAGRVSLEDGDVRQLRRWVNSGLLRDRAEAVRWVAQQVAAVDGVHPLAASLAALFAGQLADSGVTLGTAWGELLAEELAAAPDGDPDRALSPDPAKPLL